MSWVEGSIIGINPDDPKSPIVIFNRSDYPIGSPIGGAANNPAPDTDVIIEVTQFGIPANSKAVLLMGLLIITPGMHIGTPEVAFQCQAPNSQLPWGNWTAYTIAESGSVPDFGQVGARTPFSTWCPLQNGKFVYRWHYQSTGNIDGDCFGLDVSIQAYLR